jgi:hypothetical protein
VLFVVSLAGTGLIGCAPKPVIVDLPKAHQNLTRIATAYIDAESRLGRPPKNVEELKPFLKDFGNPDEMLSSPNDGLPYVIIWDTKVAGVGGFPILAYEQKGKDGKRLVADARMQTMEVADQQFARLRFPAGHKPPSGP